MKKTFGVLLALLLVIVMLPLYACAEETTMEDFTLHNGTKFGMSPQEIVDTEAEHGFIVEFDKNSKMGSVYGNGRVANFDCHVSYKCPENSMITMVYDFQHKDIDSANYSEYVIRFNTIEEGLIKKYGATDYSSQTGFSFPKVGSFGKNYKDDYPFCGGKNVTGSKFDMEGIREEYSHRLIELSDGNYVLIDHVVYSLRLLNSQNKLYYHQLRYKLLTEEETQTIHQSMNDFSSDL